MSSRKWSRIWMTPGSRSCWTWSTTIPQKATSAGRHCRSGASTMRPITGSSDDKRQYINDTGTGNTLNLSHPRVLQMVTDSLRYWVQEMHVDGFRFDLGTIWPRDRTASTRAAAFSIACRQDPVLSSQADRRAMGSAGRAAIRSAAFRRAGPNGTTGSATRCASSGRAMTASCRIWPASLRLQPTCSIAAAASRGPA